MTITPSSCVSTVIPLMASLPEPTDKSTGDIDEITPDHVPRQRKMEPAKTDSQ